MLLQSAAQFSVMALFAIEKDYIAKNLCENRDKPEMKCCGKCYLKKQLNKVTGNDDSKENTDRIKVEKQETVFYVLPVYRAIVLAKILLLPKVLLCYNKGLSDRLPVQKIFHPPSFC